MDLRIFLPILLFASCSSGPVSVAPSAKDFEMPTSLAEQFTVKEDSAPKASAPALGPAASPASVATKKLTAKERRAMKNQPKGAVGTPAAAKASEAAFPNRWTMPPFFQAGERYRFDITYFGATAGELLLEMLPQKMVGDRPAYHLRGTARTTSVFSLFYRMNDVAESFIDVTGLFSHKFSLKLDESLQSRDLIELYDQRAHKVYYYSKLDHKKKGKKDEQFEIPMAPYSQDGLSAFYYLRTLPLEMGASYEFPVINNGKLRTVRVTVVRREIIKTKIGEVAALVIKPEVVLDGAIKTYGDSFVWISDDDKRILLKVDAKIKVGSVIAYLKEHSYGAAGAEKP